MTDSPERLGASAAASARPPVAVFIYLGAERPSWAGEPRLGGAGRPSSVLLVGGDGGRASPQVGLGRTPAAVYENTATSAAAAAVLAKPAIATSSLAGPEPGPLLGVRLAEDDCDQQRQQKDGAELHPGRVE